MNAPVRAAARTTSVVPTKKLRKSAILTGSALSVLALFATLCVAPAVQAQPTSSPSNDVLPIAAAPVAATASKRAKALKKKKKRTTKLIVRRSAAQQVHRTSQVTLRIRAKGIGKRAKVKVENRGKTVAKRTLKPRSTRVRLPKKMSVGKHRIKVTVTPTKKARNNAAKAKSKRVTVRVISRRAAVIKAAKKHVGVAYRSGGSTPRGFDCSGFTSYVYDDALDIDLPRSSSSQRHVGKRVSRSKAKPGDIIWTPGHVAIYLGGNKQIDAPRPGKRIHVRPIYQRNPVFLSVV